MTSEKISIIFPPPELRNIVDKTATFVARNGPEFATRIQLNEASNMKFNFLKVGDPYHAYYQFKVKECIEGFAEGDNIQQQSKQYSQLNGSNSTPGNALQNGSSAVPQVPQDIESQTQALTKKLENLWSAPVIIREPPPPYEFSFEPPTLSQYDLDLVKLTAQFVAIHGRNFLTNLMTREQRNYQFDFLRPQHGLFQYFTHLIEQYSAILMPSKSLLNELERELKDKKIMVEKIRYRSEFTRQSEAQKEKEEAEAERERLQYSQIDWHDFALVETVDFQPDEVGDFAQPTTPDQVGSRLLLQQRIEAIEDEDGANMVTALGDDDVEMNVDNDINDNNVFKEPEKPKENPLPPLPPNLDNVVIKRNYDPKVKTSSNSVTSGKSLPENWVISPITGEKIPADKVQEHMRYSLLDPKWVEQRERNIHEKSRQEDVYAPGSSIESSLKNLAERRTDIFGSGVEETHIGMKIGEDKEPKKPESTIWDGHISSKDSVAKAARANISIEEQIQQIHKMKGLLADPDKERIGPTVPLVPILNPPLLTPMKVLTPLPHPVPAPQPSNVQHHLSMPHPTPLLSGGIPLMSNPIVRSHDPYGHMQAHPLGVPMGMYGMPPPPPIQPPPPIPRQIAGDANVHDLNEPPNKRIRSEDNLIPEEEFLSQNPSHVSIKIQIPSSNDRPEWNLNGQTLSLTLSYKDCFSTLKTQITEATNMPQNKQKLQFDGIYVKDSNSLAFYNVPQGGTIVLGFKERGGRKK